MDKNLRLLAISGYPSDINPTYQVFIGTLFREMSSRGVDITVMAAQSLVNFTRKGAGFRLAPRFERRDGLPIHRPRCLTFSAISLPLGVNTLRWSFNNCVGAVSREAIRIKGPFDMCLGKSFPFRAAWSALGPGEGVMEYLLVSLAVPALAGWSYWKRVQRQKQEELDRLYWDHVRRVCPSCASRREEREESGESLAVFR